VRVLVRDVTELAELKRIGASLLSVAPGSSKDRKHLFFVRGSLKHAKECRRLEEKAAFKLAREKRADSERDGAAVGSKRPGAPFDLLANPDREVLNLYKVEKSTPAVWSKVDL